MKKKGGCGHEAKPRVGVREGGKTRAPEEKGEMKKRRKTGIEK